MSDKKLYLLSLLLFFTRSINHRTLRVNVDMIEQRVVRRRRRKKIEGKQKRKVIIVSHIMDVGKFSFVTFYGNISFSQVLHGN